MSATASGGSFLGEDLLGIDDTVTSEVADDKVDNVRLDRDTFPAAALLIPPLASGDREEPPLASGDREEPPRDVGFLRGGISESAWEKR